MATESPAGIFKNYINGEWVESRSGKAIEDRNPANTDELVGIFPASMSEDVASGCGRRESRATKNGGSRPRRSAPRFFFAPLKFWSSARKSYARDMTREMGKVLAETRGDVQEAIDMTYLMAGEGRRQFGHTAPSELPNKFAMARARRPSAWRG